MAWLKKNKLRKRAWNVADEGAYYEAVEREFRKAQQDSPDAEPETLRERVLTDISVKARTALEEFLQVQRDVLAQSKVFADNSSTYDAGFDPIYKQKGEVSAPAKNTETDLSEFLYPKVIWSNKVGELKDEALLKIREQGLPEDEAKEAAAAELRGEAFQRQLERHLILLYNTEKLIGAEMQKKIPGIFSGHPFITETIEKILARTVTYFDIEKNKDVKAEYLDTGTGRLFDYLSNMIISAGEKIKTTEHMFQVTIPAEVMKKPEWQWWWNKFEGGKHPIDEQGDVKIDEFEGSELKHILEPDGSLAFLFDSEEDAFRWAARLGLDEESLKLIEGPTERALRREIKIKEKPMFAGGGVAGTGQEYPKEGPLPSVTSPEGAYHYAYGRIMSAWDQIIAAAEREEQLDRKNLDDLRKEVYEMIQSYGGIMSTEDRNKLDQISSDLKKYLGNLPTAPGNPGAKKAAFDIVVGDEILDEKYGRGEVTSIDNMEDGSVSVAFGPNIKIAHYPAIRIASPCYVDSQVVEFNCPMDLAVITAEACLGEGAENTSPCSFLKFIDDKPHCSYGEEMQKMKAKDDLTKVESALKSAQDMSAEFQIKKELEDLTKGASFSDHKAWYKIDELTPMRLFSFVAHVGTKRIGKIIEKNPDNSMLISWASGDQTVSWGSELAPISRDAVDALFEALDNENWQSLAPETLKQIYESAVNNNKNMIRFGPMRNVAVNTNDLHKYLVDMGAFGSPQAKTSEPLGPVASLHKESCDDGQPTWKPEPTPETDEEKAEAALETEFLKSEREKREEAAKAPKTPKTGK